jgi:hypothetical protein
VTRSPTFQPSTPAPIAFTTPAISPPGMKGSSGLVWYLFWMTSVSENLTFAAFTLTTTLPGAASREGRSSITSDSGGPHALQTTAFIFAAPMLYDIGSRARLAEYRKVVRPPGSSRNEMMVRWISPP